MIGCRCPVCLSSDPRNQRLRASALVETRQRCLLIDAGTDFRQQALRYNIERVDGVLFTHAHADHIHGIDELRVFNVRHLHHIPCYGNGDTIRRLKAYFDYIFENGAEEGFRPRLELVEVLGNFCVEGIEVIPVPLWHGKLSVLGYRLGGFAYLTDVSQVPGSSWPLLEELELLVIDALRAKPHPTHFSIEQALQAAERVRASRTVLTHLSHHVDHEAVSKTLPPKVELGYDGMVFELKDP